MHLSCGVIPVRHGGMRPVFEVRECEVLEKEDEDHLRAKGRCYWNNNLDDTEIPL